MDLYKFTLKYYPIGWKEFFMYAMDNIKKISKSLDDCDYHPEYSIIWTAFYLTPYDKVKVVILGQDPYPNYADACGASFMCRNNIPASLKNIFNVLQDTIEDFVYPQNGDLTKWAVQGVFLLNTTLTFERGDFNNQKKLQDKHKQKWSLFMKELIKYIDKKNNIVYMLWGAKAQSYSNYMTNNKNLILTSSHPSPMSFKSGEEPFYTCDHFNKCNKFLEEKGITPIDWRL